MSSPSSCIPREGSTEAVAASSHLCLPLCFSFCMTILVYAIFVIQFISSPLPAFQTGSYDLLSSLILAPPSLHPHIHAITPKLYRLMISTVKQRVEAMTQWYRRRNFPSSCLFTDQLLLIDPSHLSSITLRITARMANFWNRICHRDTEMLIALANNHQGSESASMNNVARC